MPATADIVLKVGDTNPAVAGTLKDGNNKTIPLADGDTVTFRMQAAAGEVAETFVPIDAAAEIIDGKGGRVQYAWQAGDTDEPGLYEGDFHVTFALDGSKASFPNGRSLLIQIIEAP